MSEEKQNKSANWIDQLNELDQIPGEPGIDKFQAWNKLSLRIDKKPDNKKNTWFSIAAASLLLITGFFWMNNQREHARVQRPIQQIIAKDNFTKNSVIENKIIVPPLHPSEVIKHNTSARKVKGKLQIVIKPAPAIPAPASLHTQNTTVQLVADQQHPIVLTSILPVKKKLRVVHNNELSKPIETLPMFPKYAGVNNESRSFNNELHPGLTVSSNASDIILKIKISPSN